MPRSKSLPDWPLAQSSQTRQSAAGLQGSSHPSTSPQQVAEVAAQREATLEGDKARLLQYGRELEQGLEQLGIQPGVATRQGTCNSRLKST